MRGKWILDNLLCQPPQPPPPDADIELDEEEASEGSIREILEKHRSLPQCAGCHNFLDPLGLSMENFDAIGRVRERYLDGTSVETEGQMPITDEPFEDSRDMSELVAEDPAFQRCLTKKMMTYALGRAVESSDDAWVDSIAESGDTLLELLTHLASSEPFTHRRGVAP